MRQRADIHLPPRRRILSSCAAVVAVATLSACGPDDSGGQRVASLSGHGSRTVSTSSASHDSVGADSGRPQRRLDSSRADINRMWHRYYVCLKKHGHRMNVGPGPAGSGLRPAPRDKTEADRTASKECKGKLPLLPPQMDPDKNPHYLDDYHDYITCLQDNGMAIHAIQPFGTGWTYNSSNSNLQENQRRKVDHECKLEAFGDR